MDQNRFDWVPFFKELSAKLVPYETRQSELLAFIRENHPKPDANLAEVDGTPLNVIDPFTFFSFINKIKNAQSRRGFLEKIKKFFQLTSPLPNGFSGIPSADARKLWFFPGNNIRKEDDIQNLWTLFKSALYDIEYPIEFKKCLEIHAVGPAKLTQGLYWTNPEKFFPIDGQTIPFLQKDGITDLDCSTWEKYKKVIISISEKFGKPFYEISELAWKDNNDINEKSKDLRSQNPPANTLSMKSIPLNQIFYGPPGTGKTYHTINKAIEIIEPDFDVSQGRKKVKEKFDELRQSGRIVFTTFHQSMSYEDFVEGIKPQEPTAEQLQVTYKVEPGIFKLICEKARQVKELKIQNASIFKGVRFYKMSLGGFNRSDIYEWCLENNCLALGWGNDVNFESYKGISDWATYRDKFIAENPELVKESRFNITAMYAFQNMRSGDIVFISKGNRIIDAIGRVEGDYYWGDNSPFGYFQFRKIEWLAKNLNQGPELFFSKKITQQSIYQFYDEDVKKESFIQFFTENSDESKPKPKPHVLIIDEINRGNVSQIFGELITLLETDKRMGNDEALEVTLPYSKDTFSVPPNLYLIGTMNTADRSVEALDTALRRRFSFVEMPPKTDLIELQHEIAGIRLSELLETINRRIEKLLDKDHLIGHSYFLNISNFKDLQETFYRNIIPLLQEYFFGDFGKIGLVLGAGFVEMDERKGDFADFSGYADSAELDERWIYRIKKEVELKEGEFERALNLLLKK